MLQKLQLLKLYVYVRVTWYFKRYSEIRKKKGFAEPEKRQKYSTPIEKPLKKSLNMFKL